MSDFVPVNADLHIHGLFSGAVSGKMKPEIIGAQAKLKGIKIVGTGDILNRRWLELFDDVSINKVDDSLFVHKNGTFFMLQTEVEDSKRIHHLIFFPSLSKVEEVREKLSRYCKNIDGDGRPKINLSGLEIAEAAIESECLIGPAHAFTPWTAIFKEYNSLNECYGKFRSNISFIELGLSADTNMADRISDLHNLTFLSNSDAHSPWPNKLGREFNTFLLKEINFEEIAKAIKREEGRKSILNVGLNPLEGKYHKTRCIKCLTFFSKNDAGSYKYRCPVCHGTIKKGVSDRVDELADLNELTDLKEAIHPDHRPEYKHIIPLSEIIAIALKIRSPYSEKVQNLWRNFVSKYSNEIDVLINVDILKLDKLNEKTAELIKDFREDKFRYIPGGGGVYGIPVPPGKHATMKVWKNSKVNNVSLNETIDKEQKSLTDFF